MPIPSLKSGAAGRRAFAPFSVHVGGFHQQPGRVAVQSIIRKPARQPRPRRGKASPGSGGEGVSELDAMIVGLMIAEASSSAASASASQPTFPPVVSDNSSSSHGTLTGVLQPANASAGSAGCADPAPAFAGEALAEYAKMKAKLTALGCWKGNGRASIEFAAKEGKITPPQYERYLMINKASNGARHDE